MKSTSFIQSLLVGLMILIGGYLVLYGDDRWFAKKRGEAIEKKQIVLEQQLQHRHELHMVEQKHANEKLDELKVIVLRLGD